MKEYEAYTISELEQITKLNKVYAGKSPFMIIESRFLATISKMDNCIHDKKADIAKLRERIRELEKYHDY